ncbi:hypothetical protein ACI2OX_07625 [Bacillus sp. N9]
MLNEYALQAIKKAKMQELDDFVKEQCYVRQRRKNKKKKHLIRSLLNMAVVQKLYIKKCVNRGSRFDHVTFKSG